MPTIIVTLTAVSIAADTMIANGLAGVIAAHPLALAIAARVARAGMTTTSAATMASTSATATAVTTATAAVTAATTTTTTITTTFFRIGGVHDGQVSGQ